MRSRLLISHLVFAFIPLLVVIVANFLGFRILLIALITFSVMAGLAVWTSRRLSKPPLDLKSITQSLSQAGLDSVLISSQIGTEDLAKSFEDMSGILQRTSHELVESKEFLQNVIRSINDFLFVVNPDGTIKTANHVMLKELKYEERELVGRPVEMLFVAEDKNDNPSERENIRSSRLEKLLSQGSMMNEQITFKARDERQIPMLISGSVMKDPEEKLVGIVMIAKNIEELKKMDQLKDDFISVVSHELRTPLAVMNAHLDNLRNGFAGPLTEKQANVAAVIHKNINRLGKIIHNLLDLSRLEGKRTKANRHPQDISVLIRDAVQTFSKEGEEKNLEVREEVPPNLPLVYADADMITQVLTNLMSNALRFARQKVSIFARKNRGMVEVSVVDDGSGIEDRDKHRLFNKFEQIRRPEGGSGYKGTGLGLSICKEIIRIHEGEIWVESGGGKGTEFHFTLPIDKEEDKGEELVVPFLKDVEDIKEGP